jgi:hypothetical protein
MDAAPRLQSFGGTSAVNLGEIAFLSRTVVLVPSRLLRALSIFSGAHLFGLYYPKPQPSVDRNYGLSTTSDDLVFTMVPVPLWPHLVRMRIRLVHHPDAVRALLKLLVEEGLNIVNYECTRGGFRYVTWSILAAFENQKADVYSTQTIRSRPIIDAAIERLKASIRDHCRDFLFFDDKRAELDATMSLLLYPVGGLAYFYKLLEERRSVVRTFGARVNGNRIELDDAGKGVMEGLGFGQTPTHGFASIETNDANLRVALIRPEEQERFKILDLDMRRPLKAEPTSSRGYLSTVLGLLPPDVAVWRARNMSRVNIEELEESTARLYLEDRSAAPGVRDWKATLSAIVSVCNQRGLVVLPRIAPYLPFTVFVSHRFSPQPRANRIREAIQRAGLKLGLTERAFHFAPDYVDESSTESVVRSLRESHGLLQVVTKVGTWIEAEKFGAKILGIPSVRLVDGGIRKADRITMDKDKLSLEFDQASSDEALDGVVSVALHRLIDAMQHHL